jgi:hypothetical protein
MIGSMTWFGGSAGTWFKLLYEYGITGSLIFPTALRITLIGDVEAYCGKKSRAFPFRLPRARHLLKVWLIAA